MQKILRGKKFDIKPNEIRYRVQPPDKFDPDSFRRKKIAEGVSLVLGCPEGHFRKNKCKVGTQTQALRFDKDVFTLAEAADWIEKNLKERKRKKSK